MLGRDLGDVITTCQIEVSSYRLAGVVISEPLNRET